MSFVISFVLACATILATFMLQLCDDGLDSNASVIGVVSLIAILLALYLVDYLKKFSLSKGICNFLILLTVAVQIGGLTRSRQELLAFAIANILASLQAILFFQSKTLRKCYQILFISFVEVAVGCVFQRSPYFVAALPIYAILAFLCFSLLFLWDERKYYTEQVELKVRFTGNGNLKRITAEEPIHQPEYKPLDAFDSAAALIYGQKARLVDSSRFFRRPSVQPINFTCSFFRRFILSAFVAFSIASVFFCLFPRMHELGYGPITFENIHWGTTGGNGQVKTGFKPKIELGDLGPSLDSHETVMSVRFLNCYNKSDTTPVDPQNLVYLRGAILPNYKDHSWSELQASRNQRSYTELRHSLLESTLTDPDFILSSLTSTSEIPSISLNESPYNNRSQTQTSPTLLYQILPPPSRNTLGQQHSSNTSSHRRPLDYQRQSNFFDSSHDSPATLKMFKTPAAGTYLRSIPEQKQFHFLSITDDVEVVADFVAEEKICLNSLAYDTRNSAIVYEITQRPLDTRFVFMPPSVYIIKNNPSLVQMMNNSLQLYEENNPEGNHGGCFWHLSTAIRNKRQTILTPNQEIVWPYLNQYLQIDPSQFSGLIKIAKSWDEESGIPEYNFVARARYLEKKLRDEGDYKYNRTGVLRNPNIDPLEDFITEHKEGHCEYFAGGLAMLLRAIGIPSRVVVGFATYPNENAKPTTVRQSDAHSWVEAFIPCDKLPKIGDIDADLFSGCVLDNTGSSCLPDSKKLWIEEGMWLRLDATPSAERDVDRPDALTLGIYTWSNLLRSFGLNFVLNFNAAQQMQSIYVPFINLWTKCANILRSATNCLQFFQSVIIQSKETLKAAVTGKWTPVVILRLTLIVASLFVLFFIVTRITKTIKRRIAQYKETTLRTEKNARRNTSAALLYYQVEKNLELRLNTSRRPDETPLEFIERCLTSEKKLSEDCQKSNDNNSLVLLPIPNTTQQTCRDFINVYYRAQFGGIALTPEENARWNSDLKAQQLI